MKLSMWILSDWLSKYNPDNRISDGTQILRGVRLFSNDAHFESQNVYLGVAGDFMYAGSEDIICINGNDMIILKTNDIEEVMNYIFDAFDFYNRWADSLVNDIYEGCTLQHLVDHSHDVFKTPITIFDAGNVLSGYSKEFPLGSIDDEWDTIITTKNMSLETLRIMRDHLKKIRNHKGVVYVKLDENPIPFIMRNLFINQDNMGRLVINTIYQPYTKGKEHLCETFGNIIETWLKFNRERSEMLNQNAVFLDLLSGKNVVEKELEKKLEVSGWQYKHNKILVSISNPSFYKEISRPILTSLEREFVDAYILEFKNSILMLVNLNIIDYKIFINQVTRVMKNSGSCCSVSYEFNDIMKLPIAYEQTEITLLHCPCEEGGVYYCKDYALNYINDILKAHVNQNLIHPALFTLLKNDKETGNELFYTFYIFLINERNLVQTASKLNIHRNTLVYRLNKIHQLIDLDLENYNTRAYLLLSYEISFSKKNVKKHRLL